MGKVGVFFLGCLVPVFTMACFSMVKSWLLVGSECAEPLYIPAMAAEAVMREGPGRVDLDEMSRKKWATAAVVVGK